MSDFHSLVGKQVEVRWRTTAPASLTYFTEAIVVGACGEMLMLKPLNGAPGEHHNPNIERTLIPVSYLAWIEIVKDISLDTTSAVGERLAKWKAH